MGSSPTSSSNQEPAYVNTYTSPYFQTAENTQLSGQALKKKQVEQSAKQANTDAYPQLADLGLKKQHLPPIQAKSKKSVNPQPSAQTQNKINKNTVNFCPLDHPLTNIKGIKQGQPCGKCGKKHSSNPEVDSFQCQTCKYHGCSKCYQGVLTHQHICTQPQLLYCYKKNNNSVGCMFCQKILPYFIHCNNCFANACGKCMKLSDYTNCEHQFQFDTKQTRICCYCQTKSQTLMKCHNQCCIQICPKCYKAQLQKYPINEIKCEHQFQFDPTTTMICCYCQASGQTLMQCQKQCKISLCTKCYDAEFKNTP